MTQPDVPGCNSVDDAIRLVTDIAFRPDGPRAQGRYGFERVVQDGLVMLGCIGVAILERLEKK
jgi:hypothetical protein